MVLRIEKGSIVGAYNCITNKPNQFVYKAHSQVEGYMLRKHEWIELSEEFEEIADILRDNVKTNYFKRIKCKVDWKKKIFLDRLKGRKGQNQIQTIVDLDKVDMLIDKISDMAININF